MESNKYHVYFSYSLCKDYASAVLTMRIVASLNHSQILCIIMLQGDLTVNVMVKNNLTIQYKEKPIGNAYFSLHCSFSFSKNLFRYMALFGSSYIATYVTF